MVAAVASSALLVAHAFAPRLPPIELSLASMIAGLIPATYMAGLVVRARTPRHWVGAAAATWLLLAAVGTPLGLAAYVMTHMQMR